MKNAGLWALLIKIGLKLTPVIKSAKVLKFGLAGTSLMAYSYMFTWEFALVLLASIIFHEYGHLKAMKYYGMKTKGIYLIPFFGGAAVSDEAFPDRKTESIVALAGPIFGLGLAFVTLILYFFTGDYWLLGIMSFMALINLFNLSPINPLDGGRVLKSIAFSISNNFGLFVMIAGLALAIYVVMVFEIWLLLFIIVVGSIELFFEYISFRKDVNHYNVLVDELDDSEKKRILSEVEEHKSELLFLKNKMNKKEIIQISIVYLALCLAFIGMIYFASSVPESDLALKILKEKGL